MGRKNRDTSEGRISTTLDTEQTKRSDEELCSYFTSASISNSHCTVCDNKHIHFIVLPWLPGIGHSIHRKSRQNIQTFNSNKNHLTPPHQTDPVLPPFACADNEPGSHSRYRQTRSR